MVWSAYKSYLIERLKFDFAVPFDVSDPTQTAVGSTFDTRAAQHLALFTRASFCLFGARMALTLTGLGGEFQIDLSTAAAKPVFEPTRMEVNGTVLSHMRADKILGGLPATVPSHTPTAYGLTGPYKAVFNSSLTAADATAGGKVDGWYTHPAPTEDADPLEVFDEHVEAATMWSAGLMMEAVAMGDEAAKRLSYYKSRAGSEARRIKAEMLERHHRSY